MFNNRDNNQGGIKQYAFIALLILYYISFYFLIHLSVSIFRRIKRAFIYRGFPYYEKPEITFFGNMKYSFIIYFILFLFSNFYIHTKVEYLRSGDVEIKYYQYADIWKLNSKHELYNNYKSYDDIKKISPYLNSRNIHNDQTVFFRLSFTDIYKNYKLNGIKLLKVYINGFFTYTFLNLFSIFDVLYDKKDGILNIIPITIEKYF